MDVVIVGGGIIGCALAESLATAGCRVTVLETRTVGSEASGAAAGLLAPQVEAHGPGPFLDLCLASRALFPETVARLTRETGIAIDFQPTGLWFLVFTEEDAHEAETRLSWQVQHGLHIQRFTREEILRREPLIHPSLRWGLFFPDDHQVDNAQLTRAYAEAARRRGVTIVEGVRVTRLLHDGRQVRGVAADGGRTWNAPVVVDAAGSWAQFDSTLPFTIPVEPGKGQMLLYDTSAQPLFKRTVKSSRVYCVPRSDGRLLVGTTLEFVGFDRRVTDEATRAIQTAAYALCPRLAEYPLQETWVNFRPTTPDRLPLLGPTPLAGFYLATGHFRNGILLAPITAQVLTELIVTGKSSVALTSFTLDRFRAAQVSSAPQLPASHG